MDFCCVLFLATLLAINQICSAEVYLNVDSSGTRIPSHSIIDPNIVSSSNGISCCGDSVGTWSYPNGSMVPSTRNLIIGVRRSPCIELQLEIDSQYAHISAGDEGVYTCRTRGSASGPVEMLYVGIYTTESYENSAGPVLSSVESVVFEITSGPFTHPPSLSLNCPTTSYPPTHTSWLLNGETQDSTLLSKVIRDAETTDYDNILTVNSLTQTGGVNVTCVVSNSRGSMSATRTLLVPSSPASDLSTVKPGDNMVTVSWTPPDYVLGYTVFLSGEVGAVVNDSTATSATLTELTAGVQYEITVQAFGDIPGPLSAPVSVTLAAVPAPMIESISMISSTSFRVKWSISEQASTISGFKISYSPYQTQCAQIASGRETVMGGTVTEHVLTGLQEGVEYEVRVQARGVEAYGNLSAPQRGSTDDTVPTAPPSNVSVTPVASPELGLVVSWGGPPPCEHINSRSGLTGYTVRYRPLNNGAWRTAGNINDPNTLTTTITGVTELVVYEVQVAGSNTAGPGVYSASVTGSVVVNNPPGIVTVLSASPDITSIAISWEPPVNGEGRGLITGYRLCVRPTGASFTNCAIERELLQTHKFTELHPESAYDVLVSAFIEQLEGPVEELAVSTNSIGQVDGVRVSVISEGSVLVSWNRLDSLDVFKYQVFYTPGGGRKRQSAGSIFADNASSSVEIDSLQTGLSYSFQVAAVVLVSNVEQRGALSTLTPESTLPVSVNSGVIAAVVVMVLVVIALIVVGLLAVGYYVWQKRRSGGYDITVRSTSLELVKSGSRNRMPLPDFDKPLLQHSKPVIEKHPEDLIAEEGEAVVFRPFVSGTPKPTIAWFFDGRMISSDYAFEVGDDNSLTLVSVETRHAGMYRFTASNSAGSVQGQVTLYVRGEAVDGGINGTGPPKVTSSSVALEDFGEYIEQMHGNNNKGFRDQYCNLPNEDERHTTKEALSFQNKPLNRFTNIVAYDDNRVKLQPLVGQPDSLHEYINASYIDGFNTPKKFIATQGPTDKTLADFWGMVFQTRAQMIVMITNLKEGSRVKCTRYWPAKKGQSSEYGPFTVTMSEEKSYADFNIRLFEASMRSEVQSSFKITQFHFTSWPDHGVPDYVGPMLAFHRRITSDYRPNKGPIVIHCSAGVGRTGTYMAIDIALERVENDNTIDIPAIVTELRTQRMKLVQTEEQYMFLHDAVFESLTCGSTQIPVWELTTTVARLAQVSSYTKRSGYHHQFEILAKVTPKAGGYFSPSAVQYPNKNRSMVHLPPEKYRVILKAEHPDYIHASFVNGYRKKKSLIVTQSPLQNTCRDFWKMVYERSCSSIVMLSGLQEMGQEVCYRYWPESGSCQFGEYVVGAVQQSFSEGYSERVLGVTDSKSGQTHLVSQFQVNSYDTVGRSLAHPAQQSALLSVLDTVLTLQRKNEDGPIVIHCSDTVGKSCVFCAAAILTESFKAEGLVDVFQVVKALRVQKPGAIPTVEQYEYIHNLLLTFLDSDNHSFRQLTL